LKFNVIKKSEIYHPKGLFVTENDLFLFICVD